MPNVCVVKKYLNPSFQYMSLAGVIITLGFFGASTLMIVGRLVKSEKAQKLLLSCGAQLPCPPNVISDLEKFVIRFVYGDSNSVTLGIARANKWRGQRKKTRD